MAYRIVQSGESRSFPAGDAFLRGAAPEAEVVIYLGAPLQADASKAAILVELGSECLGVHTGEKAGEEGCNVLGFARYRNGADAPSPLIELVRVGYDRDGRGVEHLHALYRPDRYALEIDLVRSGEASEKAWSPATRPNTPAKRRTSTAKTLNSKAKPAGLTPPR